ncbi:MAG: hypothetical protein OXU81_02545 [Gammaproteobacteria bacterium]|nr:hypothetical protein [Gammaproteobacteria bacterium]
MPITCSSATRLSWAGYVPNQFNCICTRHLKLDVTRNFLKDWLAS